MAYPGAPLALSKGSGYAVISANATGYHPRRRNSVTLLKALRELAPGDLCFVSELNAFLIAVAGKVENIEVVYGCGFSRFARAFGIENDFEFRQWSDLLANEQRIAASLAAQTEPPTDRFLTVARTLEPAQKAYSLYLAQDPAEQAKLLSLALSNCLGDEVSVYPKTTYRST